jgi:hypothetical protein
MQNLDESYRMLDAFAGVGATHFDMTFLDIDGGKRGFRPQQTARQIRNSLPKLLPGLTDRHQSLVIRPHAREGVTLVQLDDLDAPALARVRDVAFLTICTSQANHQAWVAVSGLGDAKDFARRLRKGTGADASASGATRVGVNYKRKYEPDFPTVRVLSAVPGRIVAAEQLEALGLVAAPEPVRVASATPIRVSRYGRRSWPDYERCVVQGPLNHAGTGPDVSRADFFFCMLAAQRGWSPEEIAGRLMELSSKARENGEHYARRTAENAAAAIGKKPQRSRV